MPYRGQSQVINDLLGGHLSMSFEVAATAIPVVQSGKMRALAVTCPSRLAQLPDTPTFAEAGIQGFVLEGLALVAAHGKTPPDIVQKLNQSLVKIINSAEGERQDRRHGTAGAPVHAGRGARHCSTRTSSDGARW